MNTEYREEMADRIEAEYPNCAEIAEAIRGSSASQCWPEIAEAARACKASPKEIGQLFRTVSMEDNQRFGVFFVWHCFADRVDVLTECWEAMTFKHTILAIAILANDAMSSYFSGSPNPAPSESLVPILTPGIERQNWKSRLDGVVAGLLGARRFVGTETGEPVPSWVVTPHRP